MKRSPSASPKPTDRVLEAAIEALRAQQLDEAQQLATQALQASKGNVRAAQVLGQALILQGRPAEALPPLEKAARRGPDPVSEALLGKALAALGRDEDAEARLRRAVGMRPPHSPAFVELGELLGRLGRFEEAEKALLTGLELTGGAVLLQLALAHLHLRRGDRPGARALFEQAHAAAPDRQDVLAGLAAERMAAGDFAAAAEHFRRALAAGPQDARILINLGKCLLELGRREEGEAALRAAAWRAPHLSGLAITALSGASHGRMFLRPSAASRFLRGTDG